MVFPRDPIDARQYLAITNFIVGRFDDDTIPEVFVVANHTLFPSLVYKLDARTGETLGTYLHVGHLGVMGSAVLNGDGVREIFIAGWNNSFDAAALVVLDPRLIAGHSPATGNYVPEDGTPGTEMYYILFPRTPLGGSPRENALSNWPEGFDLDGTGGSVSLTVADLFVTDPATGTLLKGSLIYTFDKSLRLRNVNATPTWDLAAGILLNERKVRAIPTPTYFNGDFKKKLRYWDGEDWRDKPVMNKRYVERMKALLDR
jgi:hypothetical protein